MAGKKFTNQVKHTWNGFIIFRQRILTGRVLNMNCESSVIIIRAFLCKFPMHSLFCTILSPIEYACQRGRLHFSWWYSLILYGTVEWGYSDPWRVTEIGPLKDKDFSSSFEKSFVMDKFYSDILKGLSAPMRYKFVKDSWPEDKPCSNVPTKDTCM